MNDHIIPRIEDLPYFYSPPVQFVYELTANVNMGLFTFVGTPGVLTPLRNVMENAVYFIRTVSLVANITEFDFESAILTAPQFQIYKPSEARVMLFKEPVIMNKYFDQFEFKGIYTTAKSNDQILASFKGVLVQTPALIGKVSITLKAIISAQEINDDNFLKLFRERYPHVE